MKDEILMASDMNDYFNKKKSESNNFKKSSNGSNNKGPEVPNIDFNMGGGKAGVIYVIIAIVLILVMAKPFTIIEEGQRGILSTNGKYQDKPLLPGLHFIIPIIQKVYVVDTKVRIINYASRIEANSGLNGINTKPAVTVLDKRGLPVSIELTVQYRLNSQFAAQTISNWGFSWEDKIINPVVRDIVRNVIDGFKKTAYYGQVAEFLQLPITKLAVIVSSPEEAVSQERVEAILNMHLSFVSDYDRSKTSPLSDEDLARRNARRSLIAIKDISKGKIVEETDLTFKRPAFGISPKDIDDLVGKKALRNIQEDEVLYWNMFE